MDFIVRLDAEQPTTLGEQYSHRRMTTLGDGDDHRRRKSASHSDARYMLDKNVCIYVIKNRPAALGERYDQVAEVLVDGAERSARRSPSLLAVKRF
jgi:hypothetical protein